MAEHLRKQAFMYRTASSHDLQGYVPFLESPLGQNYISFRRNALVAANSKLRAVWGKMATKTRDRKHKEGVSMYR